MMWSLTRFRLRSTCHALTWPCSWFWGASYWNLHCLLGTWVWLAKCPSCKPTGQFQVLSLSSISQLFSEAVLLKGHTEYYIATCCKLKNPFQSKPRKRKCFGLQKRTQQKHYAYVIWRLENFQPVSSRGRIISLARQPKVWLQLCNFWHQLKHIV